MLRKIDDTIALHQRKLDQLKELKKAYLQLMFPKKDETVPQVRFANFEENWELCKLENIIEKQIKGRGDSGYFVAKILYCGTTTC